MTDMYGIEGLQVNETYSVQSNNTTATEQQLLLQRLGPRQKDFVSAILLTIVYSLIFISGMFGNLCTCLVIARTHSMQTTTNYYLFSLAVSDLLLIFFGLPPELYSIWEAYPWRLGEVFCYLRQSVLEATSYASVLTITAFTMERYLAICHPLLAHKIAALSRAVKIILSIWVISFLVALPYAIHTRVYYGVIVPESKQPVPESLVCNIHYDYLTGVMYYMFQVSTFLFFVGPVTIITILYIFIGMALRRSPLARGSSDEKCYSSMTGTCTLPPQPRKTVIRMLVAVTVAFIVCWAPFHTQRLMVLYVTHWSPHLLIIQSHIFYISGVLYFVSSTVNPILYNVISKKYRAAFKQTIFPCCSNKPGQGNVSGVGRHSKSQAMVLLKNGNNSLRVVLRPETSEQSMSYEAIPLNGAAAGKDGLESSSVSGLSGELPPSPTTTPIVGGGGERSRKSEQDKSFLKIGLKKSCLKPADVQHGSCLHTLDNYVIRNRGAGPELTYKKTVAALKKAEKPRKSYAQQVNGRVAMTTSCDYELNPVPIVR